MLHYSIASGQPILKTKPVSSTTNENKSIFTLMDQQEKTCRHTDANGCCNKNQRPCAAHQTLFSKQ
jgi:hypothetical protein